MKKVIYLAVFLLCGNGLFAQGTLEFNQVLLLGTASNSNVNLGTVPSGKVWKITGMGTEASYYYSCPVSFNGGANTAFRLGAIDAYNGNYQVQNALDDIWLPAGTSITAQSCSYYRWFSIIEFNIIP